jgi:hypothetical protein
MTYDTAKVDALLKAVTLIPLDTSDKYQRAVSDAADALKIDAIKAKVETNQLKEQWQND